MNTKQRTQQRVTIRDVRGADLPRAWAEQAGVLPDQEVDVVIQDRTAAIRRMKATLANIREEAARNGLTEEKLQEILKEIDDEHRREEQA